MLEVVVVDDEKIEAEGNKSRILRMALKEIVSVKAFYSSVEAVAYLKESEKETIVFVDIDMPVVSGIDLMEELMGHYWIKFIVLSAYDDFKYAQKAMFYGVKYYLLKPCSYEELRVALVDTLAEAQREKKKRGREGADCWEISINDKSVIEEEVREYHKTILWTFDYIDDHISQRINMAVLANQLNMNYSYFSQFFKSETGYTFSGYVNRRKMQIAGELLLSDVSIAEISDLLGFESLKGFFGAFKKYYKTSPGDWKKQQIREKS